MKKRSRLAMVCFDWELCDKKCLLQCHCFSFYFHKSLAPSFEETPRSFGGTFFPVTGWGYTNGWIFSPDESLICHRRSQRCLFSLSKLSMMFVNEANTAKEQQDPGTPIRSTRFFFVLHSAFGKINRKESRIQHWFQKILLPDLWAKFWTKRDGIQPHTCVAALGDAHNVVQREAERSWLKTAIHMPTSASNSGTPLCAIVGNSKYIWMRRARVFIKCRLQFSKPSADLHLAFSTNGPLVSEKEENREN